MKLKLLFLILLIMDLAGAVTAEPLDLSPAKWIWYPSERTLQNTFILFRKEFELSDPVTDAKGWIIADSRYQLFVNGQRVQWGPAPSDPRWQEADPVDISKYLVNGKNVIACQVLYYGSGDGTSPLGIPGFLMKVTAGNLELVTDRSWKCFLARSWNPGQYKRWYLRSLQEVFDARTFPYGWDKPGFQENNDWIASKELRGPANMASASNGYPEYQLDISGNLKTELRKRSIPLMAENNVPVMKLTEAFNIEWKCQPENYFDMKVPDAYKATAVTPLPDFSSGSITINPAGHDAAAITFEFREQSVGWPYFTIDAPEGTIVELLVHEAHKPGTDAIINSHFNSWTRFICKEGINTFQTFDYESFRWLQLHIRNFNHPVTISRIGMLRRQYPFPVRPLISISDPVVARVMNASVNTLYNSAQDIVVDGMARERQQYSGDGSHQLYPVYQAFGESMLPGRFIRTFSQGMTTDGFFMDSWPAFDRLARIPQRELGWGNWGPILDHGVGFCIDTYNYYMYTGDQETIKEVYPRLVKFFNYLQTIKDSNGLLKVEDLGVPCVWMDHIAYKKQRHKQLSFNLYVAAMTGNALYEMSMLTGDRQTAAKAKQFSEYILKRCIELFWSPEERVFIDNKPWLAEEKEKRYSDRTLSTALLFHQCPGNDEAASVEMLKTFPPSMGVSYPCNAVWRYWALAENGEMDALLFDLRNRWGTMNSVIENNTLQEDWNASHDNSSQWSHSAVAPIVLLYQGNAGAKPLIPGGAKYRIWPKPADLALVEMNIQTLRGGIGFRSEGIRGNRTLNLDVPIGVEVELWLDSREKVNLELTGREKGLAKYRVPGGMRVWLKLRYT